MSPVRHTVDNPAEGVVSSEMDGYGAVLITEQRYPEEVAGTHCVRLCKAVFAHLGLVLLLISYVIGGGYMFRALELSNEYSDCIQRQEKYWKTLNFSTARVTAFTQSDADGNIDEAEVRDEMITFARHMFSLDFHPDTNCSAIIHTSYGARWNVVNAVYFCVTIITTIGYGHIVPTTFWGKLSCIIYSTLGIPLMLAYLSVIGNGLARGFRFIYWNVICCRCFYDMLRLKRLRHKQRLIHWEQTLRKQIEEESKLKGIPIPPMKPVVADCVDEVEMEPEEQHRDDLAVPLIISLIVLTTYILIGGLIFQLWEKWSFMDSVYFSFITLSTIGFGDLVPGAGRLHETRTTIELAVGAFYMLLGLALLSMCWNLLEDEMYAKFKHVIQYFTFCGLDKRIRGENQATDSREVERETVVAVLKAAVTSDKSNPLGSQPADANEEQPSGNRRQKITCFVNDNFEFE